MIAMNLNKILQNQLKSMEGQEINLNLTLKLDNLSLETPENQKEKNKGTP